VYLPPAAGSTRFGVGEAHGPGRPSNGTGLREHGAVMPAAGGKYTVDFAKSRDAVRDLATELLTIEATGDYARAKALLDKYGKETPEMVTVNRDIERHPGRHHHRCLRRRGEVEERSTDGSKNKNASEPLAVEPTALRFRFALRQIRHRLFHLLRGGHERLDDLTLNQSNSPFRKC